MTDRESLPERSKEIRERLRGKGLPSGKMRCINIHIEFPQLLLPPLIDLSATFDLVNHENLLSALLKLSHASLGLMSRCHSCFFLLYCFASPCKIPTGA